MYGFVLWRVPPVEKFPRRKKFLLGDRLQATALDVLERLVEATYTRDRRRHLTAANLGIEKLRFLCRLAKDLGHLDERRYEHAARVLDETGRLVGGWRAWVARSAYAERVASAPLDLPGRVVRTARATGPGGPDRPPAVAWLRGGSWNNNAENLRPGARNRNTTANQNDNNGFRVSSTPQSLSRRGHGRFRACRLAGLPRRSLG